MEVPMITKKAYAKINLSLEITGRREDGYHLLETVMQQISLCDIITAEKTPGEIQVLCSEPALNGDKNIAYRAADLFLRSRGIKGGVSLSIEKRIPSQAGLGGGSADAAAALLALNEIYGAGMSEQELCTLGAEIGADVPFCISGGTKLCTGIGEVLSDAESMPECEIVIVKPKFSVSTASAYREIDKRPPVQRRSAGLMCDALAKKDLHAVAEALYNDFDEALQNDEVVSIKRKMRDFGAFGTLMTGSGSAVYALFQKENPAAEACRKAFLQKYRETFLCHPLKSVSL